MFLHWRQYGEVVGNTTPFQNHSTRQKLQWRGTLRACRGWHLERAKIDAQRGLVYAATGNAYADPTPPTADAIIALTIDKGELVWAKQLTPDDAWIGGCIQIRPTPIARKRLVPTLIFPLHRFSLLRRPAGMLVIPQKSGMAYALDPAKGRTGLAIQGRGWQSGGRSVGRLRCRRGSVCPVGGYRAALTGGIHGIDVETGEQLWYTPPQTPLCAEGPGCGTTQSAAVTAIPGAVFSGAQDGGMRVYAADTGEVLWTFDANQTFETVNGVDANGASFDGSGPVIAAAWGTCCR